MFSTSEWIWHVKNHLVKLQKKWDLGRPPSLFFQNYHIFPFLGPQGPLRELMPVRPSARKVFIINRYVGIGRSNKFFSKNEVHFFSNFASGRTLPTQSTGPQPIQMVPKNCFLQISQYRSLKSKISKNLVHLFSNFDSGRTSQLVPNPFNWSPTHSTGPQKLFFYRNLSIGLSNKKR